VVDKLQRLNYEGEALHFQNTEMILNSDKSLTLKTQMTVGESGEPVEVDMTATLEVQERKKIQFVNVTYRGDESSQALGKSLIDHVNDLMDLDKFALDGTQLRIDRIRVKDKEIVFYGVAKVEQFPQRK
jgi:uncharacterized ubiquitin-like protein YukD